MNINEAVEMEEDRLERLREEGKISQEDLREELDWVHRNAREAIEEEAQQAYDDIMKGHGR